MREMKKYHLAHHYKNFELGFGVTSASLSIFQPSIQNTNHWASLVGKVWDYVFNTVLFV